MSVDCLLTYSMTFTIVAVGTDLMQSKYKFPETETGVFVTLPYLICALCMIPVGIIADSYGGRQTIIIFGGVTSLATFLLFLSTPPTTTENPSPAFSTVLPWVLLGLNQSIYYVLQWGSPSYMVRPSQISTAYGLFSSLQNLGCTLMPPLIAYVHDTCESYYPSLGLMTAFALISLALKVLLLVWDNRVRGGILQSKCPQDEFQAYLRRTEATKIR